MLTDLPNMLQISRKRNNYNIITTTMTSGVVYYLSQFNGFSRTGSLTENGILLIDSASEYNLLFVCLDENVTFTIGMLLILLYCTVNFYPHNLISEVSCS